MTKEEYSNLKRFKNQWDISFEELVCKLKIVQGQVFECYDLCSNIRYLKVVYALDNISFDLKECDINGDSVRFPYKRGNVKRFEIAARLYENDWQFYENRKVSVE